MSDRDKAISLLNDLPDSKVAYVVAYLQGLLDGDTEIPDEWDKEMLARAQAENDGTAVDINTLANELGITL